MWRKENSRRVQINENATCAMFFETEIKGSFSRQGGSGIQECVSCQGYPRTGELLAG